MLAHLIHRRGVNGAPAVDQRGPVGLDAPLLRPFGKVVDQAGAPVGTCADWRTSLINDFTKWSEKRGIKADWTALVDGWRAVYAASMDEVRKHPERGYMILDTLHRQSLEKLVAQFSIQG